MFILEEMVKSSGCFGLAYDSTAKECNVCEVKLKCESKCRMGQARKPPTVQFASPIEINTIEEVKPIKPLESMLVVPEKKKKIKSVKLPNKKEKPVKTVQYAEDMPSFRLLSMEELENLAINRGCNMEELERYVTPNIRRMRLTMAIKKTYEI